jgi:signal transduction histidine kinase
VIYLTVVLGVLLVGAVAYLGIVQRQIASVTRQLDRRARLGTHHAVTLALVNRRLNALVARVNDAIRDSESAVARTRRDEQRFRGLIADVSHDLRTPLTAVRGYQQLLDRSTLTDAQRASLDVARRHADELGTLIDHLFEYAYLVEADPPITPEPVNLTNLVAECLLAAADQLQERGLDVVFDPPAPIHITADREMVTRIVQNLVRNAHQHAHGALSVDVSAGPPVRITFTNPVPDGAVEVDRLFERFHTGDDSRSRTTGLGLSIVRLLSEKLGGTADATLDDGALSLVVELPSGPEHP